MASRKERQEPSTGQAAPSGAGGDQSIKEQPPKEEKKGTRIDDDHLRRSAVRRDRERDILQSARGVVALTELVKTPKANDPAFTLLLGAGASCSSGVPTAGEMIGNWKELLFREHMVRERKSLDGHPDRLGQAFSDWERDEYLRWLGHRKPYDALFEYFFPESPARQMHIENLVEKAHPTFGYLYLAGLVNSGRFNRILTTNFDDLATEALYRFYGERAYSLAFDSALSSVRLDSPRPKVFKLHGDFLYDNIRNLKREVSRLDELMEDKLYRVCAESGLIVVGYSGGDSSVMGPLRDMLRRDDYLRLGVHWCIQTPPGEEDGLIPEEVLSLVNDYPVKVHIYRIAGFDQVMEALFAACQCVYPGWLDDPKNSSAFAAFNEACTKYGPAVKTPTMANNLRKWSRSASEGGISFKVLLGIAENEWSVGRSKFEDIYKLRRAGMSDAALASLITETLEFFEGAKTTLFPALEKQQEFSSEVLLEERVRAHGRAIGIITGIIECEMLLNTLSAGGAKEAFEKYCRLAERNESDPGFSRVTKGDQHRASYNEVAGLGTLVAAGVVGADDVRGQVRAALLRLKPFDKDRAFLNELRDPSREPCCTAILDMLEY